MGDPADVTIKRSTGDAGRRDRNALSAALAIAFIPLAFSDVILDLTGDSVDRWFPLWVLPIVDLVLFVVIFGCLKMTSRARDRSIQWRWFWGALVANVLVGSLYVAVADSMRLVEQLLFCILWIVPQALVFQAIVSASTWSAPKTIGVPLLVGTFAAWVAQTVGWSAIQGQANPCKGLGGVINVEFFAQTSQLLPILLIAIAVEFSYFSRRSFDPQASQVRAAVVIFIVVVGEILALSVLPYPLEAMESPPSDGVMWHAYLAFLLSTDAILVAFTVLIFAMLFDFMAPDNGVQARGSQSVTEEQAPGMTAAGGGNGNDHVS